LNQASPKNLAEEKRLEEALSCYKDVAATSPLLCLPFYETDATFTCW